MIPFVLLCVAITVGVGLALKFILDRFGGWRIITWKEFAIVSVVASLVVIPLTAGEGWKLAKSNALSFNEYWNGWELAAQRSTTDCSKDGPCHYEYDCDPYLYTYTTTSTDSKGNTTTQTHVETRYHSCPYANQEWHFLINTTLGEYDLGVTVSSLQDRWDNGVAIPPETPNGIPPLWAAAKERLDKKEPGPVTKRMGYKNYILAADTSILKSYSDQIADFNKRKLLPPPVSSVRDHYYADKVSFLGVPSSPQWQNALMYLNGALGSELQGDLHLVITNSKYIQNKPDDYITALKAYWSDPKRFKDDAISKNSIIIVVGTDGKEVLWARAVTGMPLGNEEMIQAVQSKLKGIPFDPDKVIGITKSQLIKGKVKPSYNDGAIEKIIFGLDNPATKFKRVSMTGEDKDDVGSGFKYLDAQIQPSKGQRTIMFLIVLLISGIMWTVVSINGSTDYTGRF